MKRISRHSPAAAVLAALVPAALALALAVAPASAQEEKKTETKSETKMHTNPSGLQWADTKEGTGASPKLPRLARFERTRSWSSYVARMP